MESDYHTEPAHFPVEAQPDSSSTSSEKVYLDLDPATGQRALDAGLEGESATAEAPRSDLELEISKIDDLLKKYRLLKSVSQIDSHYDSDEKDAAPDRASEDTQSVSDEEYSSEASDITEILIGSNGNSSSDNHLSDSYTFVEKADLASSSDEKCSENENQHFGEFAEATGVQAERSSDVCQATASAEEVDSKDTDAEISTAVTSGDTRCSEEDTTISAKNQTFLSNVEWESWSYSTQDAHEDSATFQLFQVPVVRDKYTTEVSTEVSHSANQTDLEVPDEVKVETDAICDNVEYGSNCDEEQEFPSWTRQSSVQRQVTLYIKWYDRFAGICAPLSCSFSEYLMNCSANAVAPCISAEGVL